MAHPVEIGLQRHPWWIDRIGVGKPDLLTDLQRSRRTIQSIELEDPMGRAKEPQEKFD